MSYIDDHEQYQQQLTRYLARDVRGQVRVGSQWRKDTWEVLISILVELGAGMREAGPIASSYYASTVTVALEYLVARENRARARELDALLAVDVPSFLKYCEHLRQAQMSPTERKLLADARITFTAASLQIQMLRPDTT